MSHTLTFKAKPGTRVTNYDAFNLKRFAIADDIDSGAEDAQVEENGTKVEVHFTFNPNAYQRNLIEANIQKHFPNLYLS
ncbi:hypothetical protein [uncultured Corynebacterium sp.]|uniref:hypothetical protein n=1 Tax=uncultured Corynebacterium sp. TaxID=159447 RepID=UPI00259343E4|nr:hypothetical protein [uncultured Corynebacterium sp.]